MYLFDPSPTPPVETQRAASPGKREGGNFVGGKLFFGILTKIHIFVGRFLTETQTKIIQYEEIIINSVSDGDAIFVVCQ